MEEYSPSLDLKKAFYIVFFKNESKKALSFWCSDSKRRIDLAKCVHGTSKHKIKFFGDQHIFGCFGKIQPEQDFYLLLDMTQEKEIVFPLQLRLSTSDKGFNDRHAHAELILPELCNRKTIVLNYENKKAEADTSQNIFIYHEEIPH